MQGSSPEKLINYKSRSSRLLLVTHVAERLNMSPRNVRLKAETGELPGFKLSEDSRIWYFKESDIDGLVERQRAKYCGESEVEKGEY